MAINIIITDAGRIALVNAENTGTDPVTIAQMGLSQTAVVPLESAVALPGEFKRLGTLSGEVVADDTIHVTVTDESADAYTLRSIALYLADGTLFAIYGQAEAILIKAAASFAALSLDAVFADINAALLTFGDTNFSLPPATTERKGVVELATVAEAQAGIDALRALTPASAKAAILGWLLSQDGSGSGIDADLLDGQQGAYYTDITARLGYTPLNAISYTPADVLAKLITVDGSGSGLDADLLDGKGWNGGQDVLFGMVEAQTPNGGSTGGLRLRGNAASGYAYLQMINQAATVQWGFARTSAGGEFDWYGAGGLRNGGNIVWHAGNDGSGSGLDADLLDGHHAWEFVYNNDPATFGANEHGYWERRPNGVIEQWGIVNQALGQGGFGHNFPIGFGDAASINIQIIIINRDGGTSTADDAWAQYQGHDQYGFWAIAQFSSGGGGVDGYMWRAVGR